MKRLMLVSLFFPLLIFSQNSGRVIKISDGDTITVLIDGKQQKKLRLAEVDCPEKGQPFGKNAKQFTSNQVFGKTVTFIETTTDRYGRSIAKVYYDQDKYLSKELIKAGMGWWYYPYSKDLSLGKLQENAQRNKTGLWQDVHAISPWEYRKMKREEYKNKKYEASKTQWKLKEA
ncbi:thermonuclease family protein [Chryseobacterium indologenes]|uniref:thermonuclease family protein n=2 Tax=Chryseobacterium indologenes TaxID=253 RepID=UPI000550F690|nr:thermonuclease family protein [Chryseobacterium indologenes]MBF6645659.1 thermonuclease family protein [Chryseobacterium indologenes]MBU3050290.1 thermonuclease family protein [Chryseobacterium indologenes]MEB4763168.1 thermonuclease family protein [Chryseobacterium indologenes]QIX79955.1 thermonuclease family protein [Chryseobacterium indologenes]QPQ50449.1 thermonuclease family protein [Chryseobacterium indologenes]